MNYTELKASALSIADRQDTETINEIDTFFRMVEAKINRYLRTQKMSIRSVTPMVSGQYIYALPDGFESLKSIKVRSTATDDGAGTPMALVNNEQFTNLIANNSGFHVYTMNGDALYVNPVSDDNYIEIQYYGSLTPLSDTNLTNWVSTDHPDCYLFGLVGEINAFVKDAQSATLWLSRLDGALEEIRMADHKKMYSGNPLQMRVG